MAQHISIDRDQAVREVAEVERALSEGFTPPGHHDYHAERAIVVAARRLKISQNTLQNRVGTPRDTNSIFWRVYQLSVDWTKYKPLQKKTEHAAATSQTGEPAEPVEPAAASDPVTFRRYKDENAALKAALRDAERRILEAEDLRHGVLGLRDLPPVPVDFPSRDPTSISTAETAVLFLSDLHWGEIVDPVALDGINSFNLEIARARLGRWTNAVCDLLTKHWAGPPPDRLILIIGGDLISGGIHNELAKTDALRPLPSVRDVAEHLRHAIITIKSKIDCPIDIISLPGNHARTTIKPESKDVVSTSYDILVSDFLEMGLRDHDNIKFLAPASPDALFSIYGWRILASHGDKIGSRGGAGFIGPAATAARGFKRIIMDYAARGVHIDLILIGHFHTPLLLEEGFVNGSLTGPTEFSRDGRYRPHPAMQLMFTVHPRRKVTQIRWIEVGSPEEGSLYEPPPPDRPLRPRFRVKATTERI